METYWGSKRKSIAQFPAKIFFQKSSKSDSSESKSKIKHSILSVIKSDKSKSNGEKNSTKSKSDNVQALDSELLLNDAFLEKVSNNQNLNKVKKSSSFSSTTSLATSSSSDNNNPNSINKENDCELNNLISEFSDSFNAYKGTYLTNQNVLNDQLDNVEIVRTKIRLVKQDSVDETSNSSSSSNNPPKPPSRLKGSTSKLNKVQRDLNSSTLNGSTPNDSTLNSSTPNDSTLNCSTLNSSTLNGSHDFTQNSGKCSTIEINQLINCSTTDENGQFIVHNSTSDHTILNNLKPEQTNKLTISVQANDKPIKLEEQKVTCKNDYQLTDMKSELVWNQVTKVQTVEQPTDNGLWSTNNLNKSKRSKSVKQLTSRQFKDCTAQSSNYESSIRQPTAIKKSNTMQFDLRSVNLFEKSLLDRKSLQAQSLQDKKLFDKNFLDKNLQDKKIISEDRNLLNKSKLPVKKVLLDRKQLEKRSVDESVNKLVNKSISRLVDRSVKSTLPDVPLSIKQPYETVRNKSCSSLNQSSANQMTSSLNLSNQIPTKSRIPYSRSSVSLSRFDNQNKLSLNYVKNRPLTDNCLDVSSTSSSSCSLCTSMSEDSLDSVNRSRTSSLSNLNSSLSDRNFENSKIKTSVSMSKVNQKLESLINQKKINNYPFKDGTRSLSNLTSYNLVAATNKRILKATSNHLFHPDRELSRIDELFDDDQEQIKQKLIISNQIDSKLDSKLIQNELDQNELDQNELDQNKLDKKTNDQTNQSIDLLTNHLISSSLDNLHGCMDQSSNRSFNTPSSNLYSVSNASSNSTPINKSISTPISTSTSTNKSINTASINSSSINTSSINSSSEAPISQFKSSLINQLIDSNSHLKTDLCLGQSKLDEQTSIKEDDESLGNLNETQKSIFNSKKSIFAKNRSLMNKTDSCKSFELNERIVDLEMQLNSHKTKFNESLNLIKLLSDHCNDLIEVFNSTYNCKLKEIRELVNENQRLIQLNDEFKMENLNLNETCNDLRKHLNQEFNQICSSQDYLNNKSFNTLPNLNLDPNFNHLDPNQELKYNELQENYNKLKNALDYSRDNEQNLTSELNNLKVKFQQNYELYERVKSKALEKVESANKLIEDANKNNDRELLLAKMQIKKTEQAYAYKIAKLESELELKSKQNDELNELLDALK